MDVLITCYKLLNKNLRVPILSHKCGVTDVEGLSGRVGVRSHSAIQRHSGSLDLVSQP